MAKIFVYTSIIAAITALMTIGGISTPGGFNILSLFGFSPGSASSIFTSASFIYIFITIIGGATVASVFASFFGRSVSESYVITPLITGIFIYFVLDLVSIVNYIYTAYPDMAWLGNIFGLIFFVISMGFVVSLIQFWRGNDI